MKKFYIVSRYWENYDFDKNLLHCDICLYIFIEFIKKKEEWARKLTNIHYAIKLGMVAMESSIKVSIKAKHKSLLSKLFQIKLFPQIKSYSNV